jgi:hypothetical protein
MIKGFTRGGSDLRPSDLPESYYRTVLVMTERFF